MSKLIRPNASTLASGGRLNHRNLHGNCLCAPDYPPPLLIKQSQVVKVVFRESCLVVTNWSLFW